MRKLSYAMIAGALMLCGCGSFSTGYTAGSSGGGSAATKTCGGKPPPTCPDGCEPGCYYAMMSMSGAWECDPIDPKITGPGVCQPAGPCFANGIACGQDAYCCSGLCSEQGECEACRAGQEACSKDSECCSGVCSLNGCGG